MGMVHSVDGFCVTGFVVAVWLGFYSSRGNAILLLIQHYTNSLIISHSMYVYIYLVQV